jgi:hypothetical protein
LKKAILDNLDDYWYMQIQNPVKLKKRDYQSFATLTMARMLYTLKYGSVASKTKAAVWAMDNLGKEWTQLIENALAWPNSPQKDEFVKTVEFIKFAMEQSKNI